MAFLKLSSNSAISGAIGACILSSVLTVAKCNACGFARYVFLEKNIRSGLRLKSELIGRK